MHRESNPAIRKWLGLATLAGGLLVVLYWILYLTGVLTGSWNDDPARSFEGAFPLADTLLAVVLFSASRALFTGRPSGPFLLVWAAAMTLYLGLLDLLFYWQVGRYTPLGAMGLIQLLINALCIGGGATGLRFGWRLGDLQTVVRHQPKRLAA
ncbi:MAG: hypothetical protein HY700_02230 [Gemmatimonadetes bacterium]|nr:hypothetical protein [Gemmatimonadota bacterium]